MTRFRLKAKSWPTMPEAQPGQEQRMITDAMIEAALEVVDGVDNSACARIYAAMHATRPTADLGEDGELVARAIALREECRKGVEDRGVMPDYVDACVALKALAPALLDRLILYREALERIVEGDWHRTCEPPYEIDGSNRKVSGEWAKLARAVLVSRALR